MCIDVTNTTDKAISVIYTQPLQSDARHRMAIPPGETITIRYAAHVENQTGIELTQMPDYEEPLPADGPIEP